MTDDDEDTWDPPPAALTAPAISGLHFNPNLLIEESYADELVQKVLPYFQAGSNQVMLFGKAQPIATSDAPGGLPFFIAELITNLSLLLRDHIPNDTHKLLFPGLSEDIYPARQVILNLYRPGEGITPHVDLLGRFGDGIVGLSLVSGTVMSFTPATSPSATSAQDLRHQLWLPDRSVIVLEKEARYDWKHGITSRKQDFIEGHGGLENHWRDRHTRISITIRWLLPGAEIVGNNEPASPSSFA